RFEKESPAVRRGSRGNELWLLQQYSLPISLVKRRGPLLPWKATHTSEQRRSRMSWEARKNPGVVGRRDALRTVTPFHHSRSRQRADGCYFTVSPAANR